MMSVSSGWRGELMWVETSIEWAFPSSCRGIRRLSLEFNPALSPCCFSLFYLSYSSLFLFSVFDLSFSFFHPPLLLLFLMLPLGWVSPAGSTFIHSFFRDWTNISQRQKKIQLFLQLNLKLMFLFCFCFFQEVCHCLINPTTLSWMNQDIFTE